LTAIRFAVESRWDYAVAAIIVAAILDALDGRMARILNAASEFGAQLDSLSDIVSFGVAPAMVVYFWSLHTAGGIGWAVTLFFIVCCGLRLARFNSMLGKLPPYAYNYFTGVPAPAGALMSLVPIVVDLAFGFGVAAHPIVAGVWSVIMACLIQGSAALRPALIRSCRFNSRGTCRAAVARTHVGCRDVPNDISIFNTHVSSTKGRSRASPR
jgi:CDP-diacylglycerol--serine O-phosphatidyltransferase